MNMTHPDILKMERCGYINEPPDWEYVGRCHQCGCDVTDDMDYCFTDDGECYCSEECMLESFQEEA